LKRTALIPAAWLLDQVAGDPEWFPHPVRWMGKTITRGEAALRRPDDSALYELLSGAGLTAFVVGGSYWLTRQAIHLSRRHSRGLGLCVELTLMWTCLAARNLHQEASSVTDALAAGDLSRARVRVARIVGRDTEALSEEEVCRAVIETLAESACDGIMAPLFYMALGGVPLAMAFKAVNTLDSMIGHADHNYFYFGKAAARLDDAANYLPARLTAMCLVAAAGLHGTRARTAWRTWVRDGSRHKSPNAGQPEAAMAGALRVRLGGENFYHGERIPAPHLGAEFPPPSLQHALRAIQLVSRVTLLGVGLAVLFSAVRGAAAE
jgi:adenosylcobinamide-phosphate synthase